LTACCGVVVCWDAAAVRRRPFVCTQLAAHPQCHKAYKKTHFYSLWAKKKHKSHTSQVPPSLIRRNVATYHILLRMHLP
jgi:hypothetical protein